MNNLNDDKYISKHIVRRLPRYFRFLGELSEKGVERISSTDLSKLMNVTASQIRQDLNKFGGFGQQGYGYNVNHLHKEIGHILGIDTPHKVIMIGAGNLCSAIMHYRSFPKYGFNIVSAFDVCPEKIGKDINGIRIRSMDELESYIDDNKIDIAQERFSTDWATQASRAYGTLLTLMLRCQTISRWRMFTFRRA